jgi:hypothetical protein
VQDFVVPFREMLVLRFNQWYMLSEKKSKTVGGHHNNSQISGIGRLQP